MKKKTNQTPGKAKAETRIKCTNWRNMRVALTDKGRARPLNRKVLHDTERTTPFYSAAIS